MICVTDKCQQGDKPCTRPACGFDAESAIAASRLHRVPLPVTMEDEPTLREEWMDFVADLASAGRLLLICLLIIVATAIVSCLIWVGVEKLSANWPAAVVLLS